MKLTMQLTSNSKLAPAANLGLAVAMLAGIAVLPLAYALGNHAMREICGWSGASVVGMAIGWGLREDLAASIGGRVLRLPSRVAALLAGLAATCGTLALWIPVALEPPHLGTYALLMTLSPLVLVAASAAFSMTSGRPQKDASR